MLGDILTSERVQYVSAWLCCELQPEGSGRCHAYEKGTELKENCICCDLLKTNLQQHLSLRCSGIILLLINNITSTDGEQNELLQNEALILHFCTAEKVQGFYCADFQASKKLLFSKLQQYEKQLAEPLNLTIHVVITHRGKMKLLL